MAGVCSHAWDHEKICDVVPWLTDPFFMGAEPSCRATAPMQSLKQAVHLGELPGLVWGGVFNSRDIQGSSMYQLQVGHDVGTHRVSVALLQLRSDRDAAAREASNEKHAARPHL